MQLNRRQALSGFGTISLGALLAACADEDQPAPAAEEDMFGDESACTLTPEQTEGPYYFDVDKVRRDVREGRDGVALRLALRVRDADCKPIENAVVEIWHCDATGSYSGFDDAAEQTTYLRGAQVTSPDGTVEFRTIYPGAYQGRTVHIHAKAHLDNQTLVTTQLYFDDDVSATVYEREPYSAAGPRDTFNDGDGIFDERTLLALSKEGDGYLGVISFDVESA